LLIPPSAMPLHVPCCHGPPDSPTGIRGNYVFDVVVVPLRLQLPESHRLSYHRRQRVSIAPTRRLSRRAFIQPLSERQNRKESRRTLLSWKQVRCRRIYSKQSAPAGVRSLTTHGWGKRSLESQHVPFLLINLNPQAAYSPIGHLNAWTRDGQQP